MGARRGPCELSGESGFSKSTEEAVCLLGCLSSAQTLCLETPSHFSQEGQSQNPCAQCQGSRDITVPSSLHAWKRMGKCPHRPPPPRVRTLMAGTGRACLQSAPALLAHSSEGTAQARAGLFLAQQEDEDLGGGSCVPSTSWRIPWTEEPGGLQSMGSHRVGHD